jgi:hypothetical protein
VAEGFCTEGTVVVLDQGAGDDEQVEDFWTPLGGYENDIFPATESDDDVTEFIPTLYQLGGETPEQIAQGQLIKKGFGKPTPKIHKSLLNPSNVYLLDSGWELFLWQGRDSDRSERLACMGIVDQYGTYMPRAKHLPVSIIKEGYETSMFESYFIEE